MAAAAKVRLNKDKLAVAAKVRLNKDKLAVAAKVRLNKDKQWQWQPRLEAKQGQTGSVSQG